MVGGKRLMRRYEAEQKATEKYKDCRICYKITSEKYYADQNEKNLEKMKEALEEVGVRLDVMDGRLSLSIYPNRYVRTRNRNAGRRKKVVWNEEKSKKGQWEIYKYSDIVFMMQTMKDQEIADKIGMPIATYYRHKKTMKESRYYKSLDLNKLRDKEYLDGVNGNYAF